VCLSVARPCDVEGRVSAAQFSEGHVRTRSGPVLCTIARRRAARALERFGLRS
jgi:hypothetical protein